MHLLEDLLDAIKERRVIEFNHQKFWEEHLTQRFVEPYAVKEFKNRWYLLAKDKKDRRIKTFGLDRILNLKSTSQVFDYPLNLNIEQKFRYSYGIMLPEDEEPQDIMLSFEATQGKYIKSLPLHETQKIILDNSDELRIQLKLYITQDLIMEILSYGDSVKVLEPQYLAEQVKQAHERAFKQYL